MLIIRISLTQIPVIVFFFHITPVSVFKMERLYLRPLYNYVAYSSACRVASFDPPQFSASSKSP